MILEPLVGHTTGEKSHKELVSNLVDTTRRLSDGLASIAPEAVRVTLHPESTNTLRDTSQDAGGISQLCLLTGPEGGLSETELKQADESGFQKISLGPREY